MIDKTNLCLLVDLYELTMAESYLQEKKDKLIATFDLFVRRLPKERGYLVACGLEEIVDYIVHLKFDDEAIGELKQKGKFSDDFLDYLKALKFTGNLWALPEGEIFFAQEPILIITAPIIQAQIVESFLLNIINLSVTIATKASRVVVAAEGRPVYDFSLRRTHGQDASLKVARSSFIAGTNGTSNVLAGLKYNLPIVGTMAHSYVMSFASELESFRAYKRSFPDNCILLVDTYNTEQGIKNAIIIAKELEKESHRLKGVRIDSGDLVRLSKRARRLLDDAGLNYVKILASGDLDEYKIEYLLKNKAPIDSFGVGTRMGVSCDYPYVDVAYKLAQITDDKGKFLPTMKLSHGKITYPGKKQIFRVSDSKGFYVKDILALEDEDIEGRPLLARIIENGKLIYKLPDLETIKRYCLENIKRLQPCYKRLIKPKAYNVEISSGLRKLSEKLSSDLRRRSRKR